MLVYVRYNKDKFQYDVTKEYFRASLTPCRTTDEAQPRRGGEAQQGEGRCVLPPWEHESRVSGFVTKTRTRTRHTAEQGRQNCALSHNRLGRWGALTPDEGRMSAAIGIPIGATYSKRNILFG